MSELVDKFLEYKGFERERGNCNAPIMPNILADSLYLCWDEFLKGKLKQECKKHANRMIQCYHRFNREFFAGFDGNQKDILVDAMDEFSEYVSNELKLFRIAVKNRLKSINREDREMLSHIAVCGFLASQANDIWGIIYRNSYILRQRSGFNIVTCGEKDRDKNLYGMLIASRELLHAYSKKCITKDMQGMNLEDDADVMSSMKRFESRVMKFIEHWK